VSTTATVIASLAPPIDAVASIAGVRVPIGTTVNVEPGTIEIGLDLAAHTDRMHAEGTVRMRIEVAEGQGVVLDATGVLWLAELSKRLL
jgi:hypothetical protein